MSKRKKTRSYENSQAISGYIMVSPFVIGFIFFFIFPIFQSIIFSFNTVKMVTGGVKLDPVGLENYIKLIRFDPDFLRELTESLMSLVYQVPLIMIFSLFVATILNQKFTGRTLARAIFFMPVIIASGVVIKIMKTDTLSQLLMTGQKAKALFETRDFTVFLMQMGLSADIVKTINDIIGNIFELSWKSGIQILLFLAGLQTVPRTLHEASMMEGATPWEHFWKVVFPILTPVIILNTVYTLIDSFTDFSNPIMNEIIYQARQLNIGASSAMMWLYTIIIIIVLAITYLVASRGVFYMND